MRVNVNFIKDSRKITSQYINCLSTWLRCEVTAKDFFTDFFKAKAWNDFDYFNSTTDRKHLVMPNEVLMVDRDVDGEHWMCIGKISKNKENQRFKLLHKVIKVSEIRLYFKAGYWLLPEFHVSE